VKSGSFLKQSKKHDGIQTFYEALVNTYGTSFEDQEIKIGSKLVESYGFEKLQKLQSDFSYLENISLSRKQIANLGHKEGELIQNQLVNLTELDISFNLISSWSTLVGITKYLKLQRLKAVGNRFTKGFEFDAVVSSVKILDLSFTQVSNSILDVIPKNFPHLQRLLLSDNGINQYNESVNKLDRLEELDLSMNSFSQLPQQLKNSNIHTLNISNNKIQIHQTDMVFPQIQILDIRRNEISEWNELDQLTKIFPNVTNIRINGNPLFNKISIDEMEMSVIARFDKLTSVNGTTISKEERTNAELYFISKSNGIHVDLEKVERLAKKHGVKISQPSFVSEDNINSKLITLNLKYDDKIVEIPTLKSIEILKLKGMISRIFKISYVDMDITYEISNIKETIKNDLSLVSSYEFENGQELTIQKST